MDRDINEFVLDELGRRDILSTEALYRLFPVISQELIRTSLYELYYNGIIERVEKTHYSFGREFTDEYWVTTYNSSGVFCVETEEEEEEEEQE